jgi:hypothetical protein
MLHLLLAGVERDGADDVVDFFALPHHPPHPLLGSG